MARYFVTIFFYTVVTFLCTFLLIKMLLSAPLIFLWYLSIDISLVLSFYSSQHEVDISGPDICTSLGEGIQRSKDRKRKGSRMVFQNRQCSHCKNSSPLQLPTPEMISLYDS